MALPLNQIWKAPLRSPESSTTKSSLLDYEVKEAGLRSKGGLTTPLAILALLALLAPLALLALLAILALLALLAPLALLALLAPLEKI